MALIINEECVNCGVCEPECPNEAITHGDNTYIINADLCTECVGAYDEPQCANVCPVDACVPNPECSESKEELLEKYNRIHKDNR